MKRSDLFCDGKAPTIRAETPDRVYKRIARSAPFYAWPYGDDMHPKGIKRIRMTCPKCKRRLLSSISICHDGCCTYHSMPSHKKKGWWKRKKKKRREKQVRRR